MDWKEKIQEQLDMGFSKSDLEKLIGLPANNLSSALQGKRFYSKKNLLKIERWLAGDKPDPLSLSFAPKENKPSKEAKVAVQHSQNSLANVLQNDEVRNQIAEIKAQKIPPARDTSMGRRIWQAEQYDKIKELESKLK